MERCSLSSGWLLSCLVCRFVYSLLTDTGDFLPFMMTSVDITVVEEGISQIGQKEAHVVNSSWFAF